MDMASMLFSGESALLHDREVFGGPPERVLELVDNA